MIKLSNLADYAVVIMTTIATRAPDKLNASDVAGLTGVPQATASKVMGQLARADLLESHRGIGGGFALARTAEQISIANIIEAVDGPIALTNCIDHAPGNCSLTSICGMKNHWQIMNSAVRGAFEGVALADLVAAPALFEIDEPAPLSAQGR
ncbi:MAG: SUF system Fe-S cluster assembly regulator [Pseudomonadota bacterium]